MKFLRREKMKNILLVPLLLITCLLNAQTPLYVSTQTGEYSVFEAEATVTWDSAQYSKVDVSILGLIDGTITPGYAGLTGSNTWGPDATVDFYGEVWPIRPWPDAGKSSEIYKVVGTYANYGWYEGDGPGHDGPNDSPRGWFFWDGDTDERSFIVHSIEVTLPDVICLTLNEDSTAASATIEATSYPESGGSFAWSTDSTSFIIENAETQTATFTTELVTNTDIGSVTVTFTINGVSYQAEAKVKICENDSNKSNCDTVVNGTFGPLTAYFTAYPIPPECDDNDSCHYTSTDVSFTLQMAGVVSKSVSVTNAQISFKKNCTTKEIGTVTIRWSGSGILSPFQYFDAGVKEITLKINPAGELSGSVTLTAELNQDKDLLANTFRLKQGVTGDFIFGFAGESSFKGSFNFGGITNINIDVVKNNTLIANFRNGRLNGDGTLAGTFTGISGASYKSGAFKVTMNSLSLDLLLSINGFSLKGGIGNIKVSEMNGVNGFLNLSLAFNEGQCLAKVEASSISAFTMTLQDLVLSATFTSQFDLIQIQGQVTAKHSKFDAEISVNNFLIKDGTLTEFDCKGSVKYSTFKFELINGSYTGGLLSISAKVELNVTAAMKLDVDKYTIDQDGNISIGEIKGIFEKTPVALGFKASFGTDNFAGSFNGDIAKIGLDGTIEIGAKPDFNYGYFKLVAHTNIPLGNSGLKLTNLGGEIGFNYELPSAPVKGSYLAGLIIGVADVAGFCEVVGNPRIMLGSSSITLSLDATVSILKSNPFFSGDLKVNYRIPDQIIDGSVGSSIKIPSSGSVFASDNLNVNFNVGDGEWSANGSGMTGKLFSVITFSNGKVNVRGSLSTPSVLEGTLRGNASASFDKTVSKTFRDNSLSGNLKVSMNAGISAFINQNGLSGSVDLGIDGSGTLTFDSWVWRDSLTVTGNCNANIAVIGSSVNMTGDMNLNLPFSIPFWGRTVSVPISIAI